VGLCAILPQFHPLLVPNNDVYHLIYIIDRSQGPRRLISAILARAIFEKYHSAISKRRSLHMWQISRETSTCTVIYSVCTVLPYNLFGKVAPFKIVFVLTFYLYGHVQCLCTVLANNVIGKVAPFKVLLVFFFPYVWSYTYHSIIYNLCAPFW